VSATGALHRAGDPLRLTWRDAWTLFAAVVVVAMAWMGPVATVRVPSGVLGPADAVDAALRQAAVALAGVEDSAPAAQQAALDAITDGVRLSLVRGGTAACVEAVHPELGGQASSYDGATGAIQRGPC
jgi:hypothetical protein